MFVELPAVGKQVAKGGEAAVVERVKAASEVYAPVTGEVAAINGELEGDPALVNREPGGRGLVHEDKLKNGPESSDLMDKPPTRISSRRIERFDAFRKEHIKASGRA